MNYSVNYCSLCGVQWVGAHTCASKNAEPVEIPQTAPLFTVQTMQDEIDRLRAELADLRAYRDRTEAALSELTKRLHDYENDGPAIDAYDLQTLKLIRESKENP